MQSTLRHWGQRLPPLTNSIASQLFAYITEHLEHGCRVPSAGWAAFSRS